RVRVADLERDADPAACEAHRALLAGRTRHDERRTGRLVVETLDVGDPRRAEREEDDVHATSIAGASLSALADAKRSLLAFPAHTYRLDDFLAAAKRRGAEVVLATDLPRAFERHGHPVLPVELGDAEGSAAALVRELAGTPLAGVIATDEASAVIAALVAGA